MQNVQQRLFSTIVQSDENSPETMKNFNACLLDGANVNGRDAAGNTPLISAACRGHISMATMLLNRGANANLHNHASQTALMGAASSGRAGMVRLLLMNNVDVYAKDKDGRTAYDHAVHNRHTEVVGLLKKVAAQELYSEPISVSTESSSHTLQLSSCSPAPVMAFATPVVQPRPFVPVYTPSGALLTTDSAPAKSDGAKKIHPQSPIRVVNAVPITPLSPQSAAVLPPSPLAAASPLAPPSPVAAAPPQATTLPWTHESSTRVAQTVTTCSYTAAQSSTSPVAAPSHLTKYRSPPRSIVSWQDIITQSHLPDLKEGTSAKGRIKFSNLHKCGKGGFGQIFKAKANNITDPTCTSREYALKRQMLNIADTKCTSIQHLIKLQQHKLEGLRREAKVYFSSTLNKDSDKRPDLACPHLALLTDVAYVIHHNVDGANCEVKEPLLAMEWANASPNTLSAWMKQFSVSERGMKQRLSLAVQMFSGLVELHYGGHDPYADAAKLEEPPPLFVHQDLKPDNMLLFESPSGGLRLALTDFGLTVCYNGSNEEARCGGGTHVYMAPEQRLCLPARTPSRDIWAAAMVLAELFGGKCTVQALKEHRKFASIKPNKASVRPFVQELTQKAKKIALAISIDAEESQSRHASCLWTTQSSIRPMLLKCFRMGREACDKGAMSVGQARPTSRQCEAALKYIWEEKLGFPSWKDHHSELPMPRKTALQSYDPHQLMEFYYEHMETGMVNMMIGRYKRLISKVDVADQRIIQTEIQQLETQLEVARKMRERHHEKSQEAQFQKF